MPLPPAVVRSAVENPERFVKIRKIRIFTEFTRAMLMKQLVYIAHLYSRIETLQ